MDTPHPLSTVRAIARDSIGWSITLSILLILLGVVALAMPLAAGIAVEVWASWLLVFSGVMHLILAFHVRGAGAHVWEAIVGLLYIAVGIFLFIHPVAGLVSLTVVLAVYLAVKAVFEIAAWLTLRRIAGAAWLLVDGLVSIVLAIIVWRELPTSAIWVIGTIVGFSLLFSGFSRLALALSARRLYAALP